MSVSHVQEYASGGESGADGGEAKGEDEPKRKGVKRGASGNIATSLARRKSTRTNVSTCEPLPEDKDDEGNDAEAGRGGGEGRGLSAIPFVMRAVREVSESSSREAAFHVDLYGRGYAANSPSLHSVPHMASFGLPPLNIATRTLVLGATGHPTTHPPLPLLQFLRMLSLKDTWTSARKNLVWKRWSLPLGG